MNNTYFWLALADFLLAALGWWLIARMLARNNPIVGELAYLSFMLVAVSGALQVWWQMRYASSGVNSAGLGNGSLALLTPGFIGLAWALRRVLRKGKDELTAGKVWLAPLFNSVLVLSLALVISMLQWGRGWFFMLLVVATTASLLTSLLLARRAWQCRLRLAAALFVLNFVVVFALGLLPPWRWVEQVIGSATQAAFAFAAWRLSRVESAHKSGCNNSATSDV